MAVVLITVVAAVGGIVYIVKNSSSRLNPPKPEFKINKENYQPITKDFFDNRIEKLIEIISYEYETASRNYENKEIKKYLVGELNKENITLEYRFNKKSALLKQGNIDNTNELPNDDWRDGLLKCK